MVNFNSCEIFNLLLSGDESAFRSGLTLLERLWKCRNHLFIFFIYNTVMPLRFGEGNKRITSVFCVRIVLITCWQRWSNNDLSVCVHLFGALVKYLMKHLVDFNEAIKKSSLG